MAPATKAATLTPPQRKPLTELHGIPLLKLSVAQYQEMFKTGILKATPKVELIEGYIVEMDDVDPPHSIALGLALDVLVPLILRGWYACLQTPITLPDSSPQPDVAIIRGSRTAHPGRHPMPGEIELLVEISDSSLDDDRGTKLLLYARNRIPVYWIVNIPERQIEVYARPRAGQNPVYRQRQVFSATEFVSFNLGGTTVGPIAVADLLPPA